MADDSNRRIGEVVRGWVQSVLEHEDIKPTELARRAKIAQPTLTRFLSGETKALSPRVLRALAAVSPLAAPLQIRTIIGLENNISEDEQGVNYGRAFLEIPVWGIYPIARTGRFQVNPIPMQSLRRPKMIGASRKLIAFYAPDESMAPRWRMGEPVLVDTGRRPTAGGFALSEISSEEPDGVEFWLFTRYDGRAGGMLRLSTLDDPDTPIEISLNRVMEQHRVLEWQDLLSAA